jgi:DNA-binding CsgD family transcriptional regulator
MSSSVAARLASRELIGRRAELETLANALRDCGGGRLRLVLVSGPAGMGKSALVRRFTEAARRAGAQMLVAECAREDSSRPFGPLLHATNGAFADALDVRDNERRSLLGATEPHRAFAAIADRLRAMARVRPVVLVLEDVQWSDEETLRLIPYLSRRAPDAAIVVIATVRSEDADTGLLSRALTEVRRRDAIEIDLPPLTMNQVGLLMSSALGSIGRPDGELRSFVADHSGGNPLFVEELVRGLVERRLLIRRDGIWRPARPLPETLLPTSVGEAVRARVALMPAETSRILSIGAVIGQRFAFDLLLEIAGGSRPTVVAALRAGIAAQLIEERPLEQLEYAFRHALFRDALLGELIGPERQELHHAVALAVETATPEADLSSVASELARHFDAAGDATRGVRYHLMAARALSASAWPRVGGFSPNAPLATHLGRALALAPVDHPDRAEMLRTYAWAQDDPTRWRPLIEQSLAHAEQTGDHRAEALAKVMVGLSRAMHGDLAAISSIPDGIRLLEEFGPSADLADAHFQLARIAMLDADPHAIALAERAVELARAQDLPVLLAHALVTLGPALVTSGRIEGIGTIRAGLALGRDHSDPVLRGLDNLWNSLGASGAPDNEIKEVERTIALEAPQDGNRTTWIFFDGNWDEALEVADELSFPPTDVVRLYVDVARDGPDAVLKDARREHEQLEKLPLFRGSISALTPEVLYLAEQYAAAVETARYVGRCMDRGLRWPFIDTAAIAALAAAVALDDRAAIEEWLERCARSEALEPSTAEGRRAYARGERALREGRRDEALDAFARSAAGFDRRGATLLARTLPRLRLAELLAKEDATEARKQLAAVLAMWRAVDARWYVGRLREWAAARGLRGWSVSARRGPRLTPRELEVATLVAEGLTNKQIGTRLDITERTAETHVQRIVHKLDLRGRSHLAAWVAGGRGVVDSRM